MGRGIFSTTRRADRVGTFKGLCALWHTVMADGPIRKPDERTGLAIRGKEPVLLPEQRKSAAQMLKQKKRELMD